MSAETTEHPYEPSDLGDYAVAPGDTRGPGSYARIILGRAVVRALGFDPLGHGEVRVDDADGHAIELRPGTGGEVCDHSVGRCITCGPQVVRALDADVGDRVVAYDRGDHVRLEVVDDAGGDDS